MVELKLSLKFGNLHQYSMQVAAVQGACVAGDVMEVQVLDITGAGVLHVWITPCI